MVTLEEQRLINLLKQGSNAGFEQLVSTYQARIYQICLRMLNDDAEAQEMTQETFLKIYQAIDRFRGDSALNTWICKIAINLSKNRIVYLKKRNGQKTFSIQQMEGDTWEKQVRQDQKQSDLNPLEVLEQHAQKEILSKAIYLLEEELRRILILREIEELSYEEIAEIQNLPIGTVRSRLHRARVTLASLCQQLKEAQDV
jgi:RNA polymerase sigma-70 factor (ECF subfamily)